MFPGQLVKSAAYLYVAGIPQRIGHTYPLGPSETSAFLLTSPVAHRQLHDIEQNGRLLSKLGVALPPPQTTYSCAVPLRAEKEAGALLARLKIPPHTDLIGFHPGSAPHFSWKRWPLPRFIATGKVLMNKHRAHVLVFGGPEEETIKENLARELRPSATIISTDLLTTAALLRRCRLVIANDSGLMHLAAAAGAPTLGIFGPTDENRVGPRGQQSYTIRAPHTRPEYDVNRNFNLGNAPHPTLERLEPTHVITKATQLLSRSHAPRTDA
jgi:ADP-heptose:LPS heptosyltransferase